MTSIELSYPHSPYLPKKRTKLLEKSLQWRMWTYYQAVWLNRISRMKDLRHPFSVLDVGCGPGYFLNVLAVKYPQLCLTGLDMDSELLEYANKLVPHSRLLKGDAQKLPFTAQSFDLLFSNQVVEHLPTPGLFFKEAKRVLRPNGLLAFSTPNLNGLAAQVLGKKWEGHRFDHLSLKKPQLWRECLLNAGFELIEDGTTAITGFPVLRRFPFSLVSWVPISIWGFFPWYMGESYMAIARSSSH